MSLIIRESINVDPITTERLDTMGNIHRYNFGWLKTHTIVGDSPEPDGVTLNSAQTGISGMERTFTEVTAQSILPPSLETPEVTASTSMNDGISVGSFYKSGVKFRAMIRSRAIGTSEIIVMGQQTYGIQERKHYADAMGRTDDSSMPNPETETAEGGVTISIANGIKTTTEIKG